MLRHQKSILIVLLFTLSACSQIPGIPMEATATFTPFVAGTETALAVSSSTPTPVASFTPLPAFTSVLPPYSTFTPLPTFTSVLPPYSTFTPLPTFTSVLPPYPTFTPYPLPEGIFSPVFYGSGPFLLLGGISKYDGWFSGVVAAQFIGSEMTYDFFNPNASIQIQGSALEFDPTCGNHFMPSAVVMPETMVGVASGWLTQKRDTTELATDDPAYVQAVAEWFQSQGNFPAEIHITQILQVDLEGDGVNEILLSASYFKEKSQPFYTETGDYSILLMRKVVGNHVVTVPLVGEYYVTSVPQLEISYPNTYTVVEAVDLNGDGTLEVVVDVRRWEGWGAIVYRVDGQNVREVLRAVC